MGPRHLVLSVTLNQTLLQVIGKELATATVGEHKTIIFKTLYIEVVVCHLFQERLTHLQIIS